MKTLLSTIAVATLIIAASSCTKAPMPVPDSAPGTGTHQPVSAASHARFFDTTRFIIRDAVAPPPMSAY